MRKLLSVLVILVFALPVLAQDFAPPKSLDDDFVQWMVGEWEGWAESPMGKTKDWLKYELGLDGQFLFIQTRSESAAGMYKGMGAITLNPQSGDVVGHWIDNFRGRYTGTGRRDGDKLVIEWDGTMGKSTRITERVSKDKYRVMVKQAGPDGKMMEFSGEYTRKASSKTD